MKHGIDHVRTEGCADDDEADADLPESSAGTEACRLNELEHRIAHAAHLLPSQGPISVFVHHNTLHPFEDLPFHAAVEQGLEIYGCQPYLAEDQYRAELARGRIRHDHLEQVLLEDLGERADDLIGFMGTRYHLWLAMLEHPLRFGTDAETRWLVAETDALKRFLAATPDTLRNRAVSRTRNQVLHRPEASAADADPKLTETVRQLLKQFGADPGHRWSDSTWEAFTLQLLWQVCRHVVHSVPGLARQATLPIRHTRLLLQSAGIDVETPVSELLVRCSAAFLDQGFAGWTLPERDRGFFHAFTALYRDSRPVAGWLRELPRELRRIEQAGLTPLESIDESLRLLGVDRDEEETYLTRALLALRGWAGMLWQMETNAEWAVHPAPPGSLVEYLAVRLILERLALRHFARDLLPAEGDLTELRSRLRSEIGHAPAATVEQRAFVLFQLAQLRGWTPAELQAQTLDERHRLVAEIEAFSSLHRRRIYHQAYERCYAHQALDAIAIHVARQKVPPHHRKTFQLVTCIDDREESFRRHVEEVDADCETYGAAGFYAVAMYYQGAGDAHFRPLCPAVVKPGHYVREEAAWSLEVSSRQRAETRRTIGTASHRWHLQSRTLWGGILTALFGSLASVPLITRILFPRLTSRLTRLFDSLIQPPPVTELRLLRDGDPPGPENGGLGYTVDEMADCVQRVLEDIGLTHDFARLVILLGHGSGSLNNPHESAYNCGACSGGRGGPNARAFAEMANSPKVRLKLFERGLVLPESTFFVGGFHNTCDDDVTYFDLSRVPLSHRQEFETARDTIDEARGRNAVERCRRFESAPLDLRPGEALEHVQARSEDLSQARPEYNHATNTLCLVGRRSRTRGLFLDRRAFLTDYDPTADDADHSVLARVLAAAVPVCAGISLEYYFSTVDVAGYGCGSKLPHNVVSLLGVMEGAAGDLRTGLSQQMVEIHEAMRILFVIETTPQAMQQVMDGNPVVGRLIANDWVQLAVLDPDSSRLHVYRQGEFVLWRQETKDLPTAGSSLDWCRGRRGHLGFASIVDASAPTEPARVRAPREKSPSATAMGAHHVG